MEDAKKRGMLSLVIATFFLALMASLVRMAGELPTGQKLLFRSSVMSAILLLVMWKKHMPVRIERNYLGPVLLRGICGAVGILCNFYTIDCMNLSDATMLTKLSPFASVFFSWLILKEKFQVFDVLALAAAFVGAAFIIRPGGTAFATFPAAIGVFGGVISGLAYTYVRLSHKKGAPEEMIILSFTVISMLISVPMTILDYTPMNVSQVAILILCGVCGIIGHHFVTKAYEYAPSSQIAVFDYFQVFFSAVFGFFMFSQFPDAYSLTGYVIIIGVSIIKYCKVNRM